MGDGLFYNEIGYLPQQTSIQKDFPAKVLEIVLSGCRGKRAFHPFYSNREKETAFFNMEKLKITDLKNKCYRELSGGQQQRVLLARALCSAKKLIILDEPVAGLDPMVTNELYYFIKQINNDGMTIIMVSHDVNCAVMHASHILHLQNKPVFFGKTADYIESDAGKFFLGGHISDCNMAECDIEHINNEHVNGGHVNGEHVKSEHAGSEHVSGEQTARTEKI